MNLPSGSDMSDEEEDDDNDDVQEEATVISISGILKKENKEINEVLSSYMGTSSPVPPSVSAQPSTTAAATYFFPVQASSASPLQSLSLSPLTIPVESPLASPLPSLPFSPITPRSETSPSPTQALTSRTSSRASSVLTLASTSITPQPGTSASAVPSSISSSRRGSTPSPLPYSRNSRRKLTYGVKTCNPVKKRSTDPVSKKWHPGEDNKHTNNPPSFTGDSTIHCNGAESPYDFFRAIFTDEIMNLIVEETIRLANQKGKTTFRLSKKDIMIYLGINIIMTYIKYPNSRLYWSSISALRMNLIADAMSVNRFEEIKRYLHFSDNEEVEDPDEERDIF